MMKKVKISGSILSLFLCTFFLTSCNIDDYLNLKDEVAGKIFPNVWAFLVQFIAFIIMIVLIIVFAYKPIKKYIDKRKELLEEEVNTARDKNLAADKTLIESEKIMANAHKKATQTINKSVKEAMLVKEEILAHTEKEIAMKREAEEIALNKQINNAKLDLHNEIVDVALKASKQILKREVTTSDNDKILNDFITEISGEDD